MVLVAVRCQDCDFVAARLQSHGGIDDQAFGASNPKVRMHEDDAFLVRRLRHAELRVQCSESCVREMTYSHGDLFWLVWYAFAS